MTGTEKWYDRVRDHPLTRIEETLTTLKTLRASEADAQTREELEEILTQQIDTISDLQTHAQALSHSTTSRLNLHTGTDTENQQKTYTYRYTADTEK